VTFDPRGREAWAVDGARNEVVVAPLAEDGRPGLTIPVGQRPIEVAFAPDGLTAWVSNHLSHDVSVIAVPERRVVATVPVGQNPLHIAFAPDGRRAYVTAISSNDVTVVDALARRPIGKVAVGRRPDGIATGKLHQFALDGSP
jgi:YVTN family beta-propeller protein